MTTICGHKLTAAQLAALDELTAYLKANSGDTGWHPSTSPSGDGRWMNLVEVWGRSGRATARRTSIHKLHKLGVLAACEIAMCRGWVKGVPMERLADEQMARERECVEAMRGFDRLHTEQEVKIDG